MKKLATLLITLCLILGTTHVAMPVLASDIGEVDYSSSLDVVIVMDQSSSMRGGTRENDPQDFRLDAAQMMISMLDTKSRVAFVPFARSVLLSKDNDFYDLTTLSARNQKNRPIEELRGQGLSANTDLGEALQYAIYLLMNREDDRRTPMIIALTDGSNQINDKSSKSVLQWNNSTKQFETKQYYQNYYTSTANKLEAEATDLAREQNIPIYTVALSSLTNARPQDLQEAESLASKLASISNTTGGKSAQVTEAAQLPEFFGQLFAERIGSSVLPLKSEPVPGKPGEYVVKLPILNKSVKEANIFVSLEHIQRAGGKEIGEPEVELYGPTGENPISGRGDVMRQSSKNFLLFKIEQPQEIGIWRLQYTVKDGAPSDGISFSLLYNYDIALQTELRMGNQNISPDSILAKGDRLTITSRFINQDGTYSDDKNLYNVYHESDPDFIGSWQAIKAYYTLTAFNGKAYTQELQPMSDRFELELDLKTLDIDPDSAFNLLSSGKYTLNIHAEGAGLERSSKENSFQVKNSPPSARSNEIKLKSISVDDPKKEETRQVQEISLLLYSGKPGVADDPLFDPDNDRLSNFVLEPSGTVFVDLNVETNPNTGEVYLKGKTLQDSSGYFRHGTSQFVLSFQDSEDLSYAVPVSIDVRSVTTALTEKFQIEVGTTGLTNEKAEKNSEVSFTIRLKDRKTNALDRSGAIENYRGVVEIINADQQSISIDTIDLELNTDRTALVGSYQTPNHRLNAEARVIMEVDKTKAEAGRETVSFQVDNAAPETIPGAEDTVPVHISYDPLPEFLSFLEQTTPEDQLSLNLVRMFRDEDQEDPDQLKYAVSYVKDRDPDAKPGEILALDPADGKGQRVGLSPIQSGKLTLRISMTDGDSEEAFFTKDIQVYSLVQKWTRLGLIALVALIALIILSLLVRQARKPRFPADGVLLTMENDSIYPSERYEFVPTKKHLPMHLVLNDELAQKFGLGMRDLANLILAPRKKSLGAITLYQKKADNRVTAELDGVLLGKKKLKWETDRELVLRKAGTTQSLRLRLASGGGDGFGQTSTQSWNTQQSNDFFGTNNTDF